MGLFIFEFKWEKVIIRIREKWEKKKKRRGDKINEHGVVSNSIDSKIL